MVLIRDQYIPIPSFNPAQRENNRNAERRYGTGILPVFHGRDTHAAKFFDPCPQKIFVFFASYRRHPAAPAHQTSRISHHAPFQRGLLPQPDRHNLFGIGRAYGLRRRVQNRSSSSSSAPPKPPSPSSSKSAPYNTVVQGEIRDGRLIGLEVTPASRRADVVDAGGQ